MADSIDKEILQVIQSNHGVILGYLVRVCGSFDDAEDTCQDVSLAALSHWRQSGIPDNPRAWLFRTARNRLIDRQRFLSVRDHTTFEDDIAAADSDRFLEDDLLRLIFTCCHPAIAPEIRVPLTLKAITGLSLDEVARAFLVTPAAMEQRLLRGKRKISAAGIAYEIPEGQQLELRLESVMQTLYLLFNEGYAATSGNQLIRRDLMREAIRLATLMQRLFPGRAELMSLLALMLFQDSRSEAREDKTGELILLEEQDRSLWDRKAIQQGQALLDKALHLHQPPGRYQLQASIAALHAEADSSAETDWNQIAMLYRRLLTDIYTPVLHLNYAVAIAMAGHLQQAMTELETVASPLARYFPFFCARADFNQRLGQIEASRADYETALTLTRNEQEQAFVRKRLSSLDQDSQDAEGLPG